MKYKKHSDEQKVMVLKELDAGMPIKELTRKYGVSDATIYNWKKKFGGIDLSEVKRLRHLDDENRKLKRLVADLTLDNTALKDIVSGKL